MPRTTSLISARDLEVLLFVARFGVVPSSAIAASAKTGQTVSYGRESRWIEHQLVRTLEPINGSGRLLVCTREGLRAVGLQGLGPGYVSVGRRPHAIAVATLAAQLESEGQPVLSERELAAEEDAERKRIYSAQLSDGRFHRPDLVLRGKELAIEVELSQKAGWRLDAIVRAWRRAVIQKRFDGVRYICGPRALRAVRNAVRRTSTERFVEAVALPSPIGVDRGDA